MKYTLQLRHWQTYCRAYHCLSHDQIPTLQSYKYMQSSKELILKNSYTSQINMCDRPSMKWQATNSPEKNKKTKLSSHTSPNTTASSRNRYKAQWRRRRASPRKVRLNNIKDWIRMSIDDLFDSTRDRTKW